LAMVAHRARRSVLSKSFLHIESEACIESRSGKPGLESARTSLGPGARLCRAQQKVQQA
jgi:hypothetical protein